MATHVYRGRVASLVKQLLNDTEGFLNTWSQAMRLLEDGWSIELGHVFFKQGPREKDVDIRAEKDDVVRFIDVINFAPKASTIRPDGFMAMPGSAPVEPKLLGKVQEQWGTKFSEARAAGWRGSAWVAVDYAKNSDVAIDLWLRKPFTGEDWRAGLASDLAGAAAQLDGVIYYEFGVTDIVRAPTVKWTPITSQRHAA